MPAGMSPPASSFTLAGQQFDPISVLIATSKQEKQEQIIATLQFSPQHRVPDLRFLRSAQPIFVDGEYRNVHDPCHFYFQHNEGIFNFIFNHLRLTLENKKTHTLTKEVPGGVFTRLMTNDRPIPGNRLINAKFFLEAFPEGFLCF